jgi:hypothetical protein
VRELGGRWGAWRLLSSAASPNQIFYNTKVDGEDNGPQRDGALVIKINAYKVSSVNDEA